MGKVAETVAQKELGSPFEI